MSPGRVLIGYGRSGDFKAPAGMLLEEQGGAVYAVPADHYCRVCDGCGCRECKWTGEEPRRRKKTPRGTS